MCTDPVERPSKPTAPPMDSSHTRGVDRPPRVPRMDLEEAHGLRDLSDPDEMQAAASFRGLTFAHVTNQIWHFCSVDYGPRCMPILLSLGILYLLTCD
jgi:hypothetical protein